MTERIIEIREPNKEPVRHRLRPGRMELGRETADGLRVDDPSVSRRHLVLALGPQGLTVTDLGSTNGTVVNGSLITTETSLQSGDVIRASDTEIRVLDVPSPAHTSPRDIVAPRADRGESPHSAGPATGAPVTSEMGSAAPTRAEEARQPESAAQPVPVRPALDELATRDTDAAVIRYRPGTTGEAAAAGMASALRRARRRLAGLGSEPWGSKPQVCLVDPIPDPDRPGTVMTSGTIVDPDRNEIWMVVTAESPPEPSERPLALLFGSSLPAAEDLELLLEGYALHVADDPDPNPRLREQIELPSFNDADDDLRAAMALSFVRYLVSKGGIETLRRFFVEARPGRLEAAAAALYGTGFSGLEDAWRRTLEGKAPGVRTTRFLRLTARYLRPHVREQVEMLVLMLIGLVFVVVFPFAYRRLIDDAIPSGSFSQVLSVLGLLLAAFLASLAAELRSAYVSARLTGSIVKELRVQMFTRLQTLSAGWYHRHQEGDVTARLFSDVAVFERGVAEALREGVSAVLSLAVAGAVAITLNPLLGIIVLAGAPLVAMAFKLMGAGAERRSSVLQERTGALMAVTSENYQGQGVVKSFGLETRERSRFVQACDRLFAAHVSLELYTNAFGSLVGTLTLLLRLVVLGLGAWLILEGDFTVGGLVAFLSVEAQVLYPVRMLTTIGQRVQSASGALVRINELLDAAPDVADAPESSPLAPLQREIRFDSVSFSYTRERPALEDFDAVIIAGTRVAFVGPTGAGKSSVLQLLMRLYDPDEGAVRFDGRDLRSGTVASLRGQLGVVHQDTFLFDSTIRENIAMGGVDVSDATVEQAARDAELHDFVMSLPRGYDTPVGERGSRLSGGQRQRLAIARALVRDPRILVLDEATSALDPRTERLIATTLERVGENRTMIAVTHRLSSIVDYDEIFVIVSGRLVERGTHEELVRSGGVYAELWVEQSGGVVAAESPFDLVAAVARIPLFGGLDTEDLESVARRLRASQLAPGETLDEGGGRLVIVRRGRGQVLQPSLGGRRVPVAELGSGDAFGLAALLGTPTGAVLQAIDGMEVLTLDDEAIAGLAATFPAVAASLAGLRQPAAAPAGGRRLTRLTATSARALEAASPTETTSTIVGSTTGPLDVASRLE